MRKFRVLIAFLFFFSATYAHLSWTCKSDSVVIYSWQNGIWTWSQKEINQYDFNGNLTQRITKSYDLNTSSWTNTSLELREYLQNENVFLPLKQTVSSWNNNQWDSVSKVVYDYTPLFNLQRESSFNWSGNQWNPFQKEEWVAPDDSLVNDYITQSWNGTAWENVSQQIQSLDGNGNVILEEQYFWSMSTNQWEGLSKFSGVYVGNDLTEYIQYVWLSGVWNPSTRVQNTYDMNHYMTQRVIQLYNTNAWQNFQRIDVTYLNNMEFTRYKYVYDTTSLTWKDDFKALYMYDASMNRVQLETYKKVDTNWIGLFKNNSSFDTNQQLVDDYIFQWNGTAATWVNQKWKNIQFLNNRQIETNYDWNMSNNLWDADSRDVFIVDFDDNLTSSTSYQYNVTVGWRPVAKDSFEYDTYSNEIMEANYVWDNIMSNWVGISKQENSIHKFDIISQLPLQNCNQDSAILLSANNSALMVDWWESNASINKAEYMLNVEQSGLYFVYISDVYCTYNSDSLEVKIGYAPLLPSIIKDQEKLRTQDNSPVDWYMGNQLVAQGTSYIIPSVEGEYWIQLEDSVSQCSSSSNLYAWYNGINEVQSERLAVQPTLVTNTSWINLPIAAQGGNMQIIANDGRLVKNAKIEDRVSISYHDYTAGIYFVLIQNDGLIWKSHFVVP